MKKQQRENVRRFIRRYRIEDGSDFRLKDIRPGDTRGITDKAQATSLLRQGVDMLAEMQDKLYAQDR